MGNKYSSVKEAREKLGVSISQYYFMINNDISMFNTVDEIKNYIWSQRNKKISEAKLNERNDTHPTQG